MRGVHWFEELWRGSLWKTRSDDELRFGAEVGMVGAGCRELLWKKFGHHSGGGGRKARSDAIGSVLYGVRREIGKSMPTGDIWFTASIKVINAIN